MHPAIDQIGKPIDRNNPIINYASGEPDTELHPFFIIASDNNNIYAFAMTSSNSQQNQTIVAEALYQSTDPKKINYTNPNYAKDSYINCQNIHAIPIEKLKMCKNIAFTPRSLKFDCIAKYIFNKDNSIAKEDPYMETVLELIKYPVSHFRFSDTYKNLHTKFTLTETAKHSMQIQQERVKNGVYSTEKTTWHNKETGEVQIKSQYTNDYHQRKAELQQLKSDALRARDAFSEAPDNYYGENQESKGRRVA